MQPYIDAEFLKKREGKLEDKEGEGRTLLSSLVQYTDGEALVTASIRENVYRHPLPYRSPHGWRRALEHSDRRT
jgi:hypothetical protein